MELSRKARAVQGSVTLAIDAKAKELKAQGKDVIGFGAGEPDFPTPEYICEAARQALAKGMTKYTPVAGTLELRKAISDKLKKENGLDYTPEQIVVSGGAKHSLFNALQAICNPGDEVIVPGPYWVSYPELVRMADATPVIVSASESQGFMVNAEQIQAAITPRTKAIIINSPNNPNGFAYTAKELKDIADVCVRAGIFVISDEIYEHLLYDGLKHVSIASFGEQIKKQTILVNGLSKSHAMTGWRIGYTASELNISKVMTNFQSQSTSAPNSMAQYASYIALKEPSGEMEKMRCEFEKRRNFLAKRINEIDGLSCILPKGAFYIMMNISKVLGRSFRGKVVNGPMAFTECLLDSKLTAVVPGEGFGADEFVRLSYATSMDNISRGIDRIEEFVNELE